MRGLSPLRYHAQLLVSLDGHHGARIRSSGVLHQLRSISNQFDGVFQAQDASYAECRYLTKDMAH